VLRYASYCYDAENGMYYLSARHYDPGTRQFLSKDPAKDDGEASAYQYGSADPVGRTDPTGESARKTYKAEGFIWYKWSERNVSQVQLAWTCNPEGVGKVSQGSAYARAVALGLWRVALTRISLAKTDYGYSYTLTCYHLFKTVIGSQTYKNSITTTIVGYNSGTSKGSISIRIDKRLTQYWWSKNLAIKFWTY
jgi:RHS repeat-associated protein